MPPAQTTPLRGEIGHRILIPFLHSVITILRAKEFSGEEKRAIGAFWMKLLRTNIVPELGGLNEDQRGDPSNLVIRTMIVLISEPISHPDAITRVREWMEEKHLWRNATHRGLRDIVRLSLSIQNLLIWLLAHD